MEDDHVDRLGVEVRQRMKLTSTNRSIGLIVPIAHAHHKANATHSSEQDERRVQNKTSEGDKPQAVYADLTSFSSGLRPLDANLALCRPGGSGGVAAPVPIPNTAVKRPSADGTSS